ncbi:hypothetical protein M408DRAFT_328088 [Serendipita vermifera MAFF 305830]|uniref:Matrin-type domain-containing protein n=1 Tax=Serendipita vermifera MAFF 305830 TaxID=933852 RepID=A0A0C3B166_SERVB|nr:hypothetical protein M408DRAFT_328088 [Serendipita vermifera MAFF 305830]
MSEYWVSHKKYYCKYCEIYIADDAPSRSQHENGLRHQGNKERFIRNLYKTGEKKKRDDEEEKREIARIEQAAGAAFASDVQTGRAKASTSSAPAGAAAARPSSKPALSGGVYANYTTAKDLGIEQEEERIATEAFQLQQSQGVVGQWEMVESTSSAVPLPPVLPQKRPLEDDEDEEGEGFRVRRRKLAEGLGEVYDPGKIVIVPKRAPADAAKEDEKAGDAPLEAKPQTLSWSTKRWKAADTEDHGNTEVETGVITTAHDEQPPVMEDSVPPEEPTKSPPPVAPAVEQAPAQPEPTETVPAKSMFKKRKAPTQPVGEKKGVRRQL